MIHYRKAKAKKTVCGINLIDQPSTETRTSWRALLKPNQYICQKCLAWEERREKKKAYTAGLRGFKALQKRVTDLWRKAVWYDWGGKCALCGKPCNDHNAHHYFTKGVHAALRYNPKCGVLLDYGCHIGKVHRGGEIEALRDVYIAKIGGALFEILKRESFKQRKYVREDFEAIEKLLTEYTIQMEAAQIEKEHGKEGL